MEKKTTFKDTNPDEAANTGLSGSTEKPPPVAAVLVLMAVIGLVIGLSYHFASAPMFPDCNSPYDDFLGPSYQGGVAAAGSLKTAALLGVGLWLVAAVTPRGCGAGSRLLPWRTSPVTSPDWWCSGMSRR